MPSQNELQASACNIATDRDTNADVVATATAPTGNSVRAAVAIFGVLITSSAVPAAAVEATLTDGTTTMKINLPATVFPAGFVFTFPNGHPFVGAAGQAVTLTVPALGSGVICNASLFWRHVNPL